MPNLVYVGENQTHHEPPVIPPSFDEEARITIKSSFEEAKKLLSENRLRPAVQELLWLLETITTAFKGQGDGVSSIEGEYFNKIIQDMRRKNKGTTLDQVIQWIITLHGYLSAPAGGVIRHGLNLKEGIATSDNEARLYCDLIISYIKYFLGEFDKLNSDKNSF